jgi:hypothetical protein
MKDYKMLVDISKFWFLFYCLLTVVIAILIFELPNTLLFWIIRPFLILLYIFVMHLQYVRGEMSGVSLFPVITIFNLISLITYYFLKIDILSHVISYIWSFTSVSLFLFINKDINEYYKSFYDNK